MRLRLQLRLVLHSRHTMVELAEVFLVLQRLVRPLSVTGLGPARALEHHGACLRHGAHWWSWRGASRGHCASYRGHCVSYRRLIKRECEARCRLLQRGASRLANITPLLLFEKMFSALRVALLC